MAALFSVDDEHVQEARRRLQQIGYADFFEQPYEYRPSCTTLVFPNLLNEDVWRVISPLMDLSALKAHFAGDTPPEDWPPNA